MNIPPANLNSRMKSKSSLSSSYETYLNKDISDYNSRDLVFYFADSYKATKGVPYFISVVQDSAKMKRLMEGFDNYTIVKLIDYVTKNKDEININMLCSTWVNTFIQEAGIFHPEFSKFEVIADSPFLTEAERIATKKFFTDLLSSIELGDVHKEAFCKNKLEEICNEVKRRRKLLNY